MSLWKGLGVSCGFVCIEFYAVAFSSIDALLGFNHSLR